MNTRFDEKGLQMISKYIDLIDADKFVQLYDVMNSTYVDTKVISSVSSLLLDAHINPLTKMDIVPKYFLAHQDYYNGVIIPDIIEGIGVEAFQGCGIDNIVLPKNLTYIADRAFWACKLKILDCFKCQHELIFRSGTFFNCNKLQQIYLPNNIKIMFQDRSFQGCSSLNRIIYDGRLADFDTNVSFAKNWAYAQVPIKIIVHCIDGYKELNIK